MRAHTSMVGVAPCGDAGAADVDLQYVERVAIRVVLAEDNYLVREGILKLLQTEPEIEIVGVCSDLDELLAVLDERTPDVVVTDIRMPPTGTNEGIRAANYVRAKGLATGVVVLSHYADPSYMLALLERGSQGRAYLLKERVTERDELMRAVREVSKGGSVIDSTLVDSLVTATGRKGRSELERLTQREWEVLAEMAKGKSNAAIAARLVISERAVEKHINSILSKLGLADEPDINRRVKAVLLYLSEQD